MTWNPLSWQDRPALQQAPYPDPAALEPVLASLRTMPPLVFPGEVDTLRQRLAQAEEGRALVLQGGDCAERFVDCREEAIANKFRILLQMAVVLTYGLKKPVVKMGRLAGQYGKPRSSPVEDTPQGPVASYFGDNVNGFHHAERQPDPKRLLEGYFRSAATLNYLRAMVAGGFTDLHHPDNWDMAALSPSPRSASYQDLVARIGDSIAFMESFGGVKAEELGSTEFWVAHEGLHLPYESALVRPGNDSWYATSAHFLWIGERTRNTTGAHVEFFRGLANPVGVKLGPGADPAAVLELSRILNPLNLPGKLAFITRMGRGRSAAGLPPLLKVMQDEGRRVLWICDPMHGNTETAPGGRKTRRFDAILGELEDCAAAHAQAGTVLGGVHFELTGEDVTECMGGPSDLKAEDLDLRYETWCDPRLNYGQSLEMAFRLAELLQSKR